jgi:MFS family permease
MVGFLQVYGYPDQRAPTGWNIATVPQQLISSFLNVGTIIGVLLTAGWARHWGRRPAIWMGSAISFVAAGLQVGTTNLVGLYFGRILIGISNGFYITFANV